MTALTEQQRTEWNAAQTLWGVNMHEATTESSEGVGSFAWFTFPPKVAVDVDEAQRLGVDGELATIFAHEIGHHVLSPSTRINDLKLAQQMARALAAVSLSTTVGRTIPHFLSNLWSDLLINTRVYEMQRNAAPGEEPGMLRMWRALEREPTTTLSWWVIMRAYEDLWRLPSATLCTPEPPAVAAHQVSDESEDLAAELRRIATRNPLIDASLIADTVRTFGDDPIRGALRFGMIYAPYIVNNVPKNLPASMCGGELNPQPATGAELDEVFRDARLNEQPRHPLDGDSDNVDEGVDEGGSAAGSAAMGQGYGLAETLALYGDTENAVVMQAWYMSRARQWVRPYVQVAPATLESGALPGALETWAIEDDVDRIDWAATLANGARVVPGVTTKTRTWLDDEAPKSTDGVVVDLYIDSSGSMRSPQQESPAVLAGTILILSVLSGGGRVRVTSFAGTGQVAGHDRFTGNRDEALADLLAYFGGGTVFPLDLLQRRYSPAALTKSTNPTRRHLVVLSDDGLSSFFGTGQEQYAGVAARVNAVLDTGTLVVIDSRRTIAELATRDGYATEFIDTMDDAPAACAALAHRIATYTPGALAHG